MHYPDLGIDTLSEYENSAVISQMSFHRETRGGILKCWLFSQARPLVSREVQNVKHKMNKKNLCVNYVLYVTSILRLIQYTTY